MKFIYLKTKRKKSPEHALTASFFFHARGEYLEKSIAGMYRSLLLQLLEGYPGLQEVLDDTDLVPRGQTECPPLNILKDLFHEAASKLGQRSFTCFVDALDECDEQQVMEMVRYFEDLAESCASKGARLQICFSSRHYPYIRIRHGIELILEHQQGHSEDMDNYVQSNLQIRDTALVDELRPQILEKAAGVFLWVVLVIDILNKENRRGRLALRKRLAEVPSGLTELFKDILRRDHENMEDLLLCILWILCAKRPLRPEEYYHALWSGLVLQGLADSEVPDVTVADLGDCVNGHVITSSKGLAEITKAKTPTVQFIHESVRDFLIRDRGLQELWPDIGFDWETSGHERLKQCCSMYINHELVRASVGSFGSATQSDDLLKVSKHYPFLEYASQYVLYHADVAARAIPQEQFLSQTSTLDWVTTINLFEKFKIRKYSPKASLTYILADKGFSELIRNWIRKSPDIDIRGERYELPLFAALANGNKDAVAALLNMMSSIYDGADIAEGFGSKKGFVGYKGRTPLTWAAQGGLASLVKLLVRKGAAIDGLDLQGYTPLMRASKNSRETVARFLIEQDADVNAKDASKRTPLYYAISPNIAIQLLNKGADVNAEDDVGQTPLHKACDSMSSWISFLDLLTDKGVSLYETDKDKQAVACRAYEVATSPTLRRILLEKGADVNARDRWGQTPLHMACKSLLPCGREMVHSLIGKGADLHARDNEGSTPLHLAVKNGNGSAVKLLVKRGADVDCYDNNGETPSSLVEDMLLSADSPLALALKGL